MSRESLRRLLFSGAVVALLAGCTVYQRQPASPAANARETLQIELGNVSRTDFVAALQSEFTDSAQTKGLQHGGLEVQPGFYGPMQTTTVPANALSLALEDARAKAETIARDMKVTLGPVQSVTENFNGVPAAPALKGNALALNRIVAMPGQPIVVSVVFGVESAPDRTIAVFGTSPSSVNPGPREPPFAKHVRVSVSGNGASLSEAAQAMVRYDAIVRQTAKKFSLPDSSITVVDSGFSTT